MAVKEKSSLREDLGVQSPADVVQFLNLFVYGDPGVGKTLLAGTAQDHEATKPIIIFDVDGGLATLRDRPDIDVVPVRSMKALEDGYNKLWKASTTGDLHYKTCAVDSATELQKLDMGFVMKQRYNEKPDTTDLDVPSPREWGKNGNHIRQIVRAFRDLPMNTIITAHTSYDYDEASKITYIRPGLPGKMKFEIAGFVDIVGYMNLQFVGNQTVRRLQFEATRRVIAKDRTNKLGAYVDNPTIPLLWEMMHAS